MNEPHTITCVKYRDRAGNPTCAVNFVDGQYCRFLRTRNFGIQECCCFAKDSESLQRRGDGTGSLIPGKDCEIFSAQEMEENRVGEGLPIFEKT